MISPLARARVDDPPVASGSYDVAVLGAGIGGLTAGILLARAGLRVVIVEPERFPHDRLGESLDWGMPGLLRGLGIEPDDLLRAGVATRKLGIDVDPREGPPWSGRPKSWFRRWPLRFELVTLNAFRPAFDQRLVECAQAAGVAFIWDRVVGLLTEKDRVTNALTAGGSRVAARWFIDASGQAQVIARALDISRQEYGQRKVCLWAWFEDRDRPETTMFYGDNADAYLAWIWEIPITPTRVSVGCVMSAERFRAERAPTDHPADVFRRLLAKHERFAPLLAQKPEADVRTCSWRSYVAHRVCGPNWLIVGEAASLPDPLTANGATAAMRHAHHAARAILAASHRGKLSAIQRQLYSWHVRRMGQIFNYCIEAAAYDSLMRWGLGPRSAQRVYTTFSYLINALYSRLRPQSALGISLFFGPLLGLVRVYMRLWALAARLALRSHPERLAAAGFGLEVPTRG